MSLYNSKIFLLVCLFFINNSLNAQSKCNFGYLAVPDAFRSYTNEKILLEIEKNRQKVEDLLESSSDKCWYVYSDRRDNKLRKDPDVGAAYNNVKLHFLQKTFVKSVKGNWLNLYSLNNEDLGWIRADKLLLSSYTMLNEKSFPRKALVLMTIPDNAIDLNEKMLSNTLYEGPKTNKEAYTKANKMDAFFIAKKESNRVLLLKVDDLNSKSAETLEKTTGGWIAEVNITSWDHRLCLEPSAERYTREGYGDKKLRVFKTKLDLDKSLSGDGTVKGIKTLTLPEKRPNPNIMRMPILEHVGSEIKKVAIIASLNPNEKTYSEIEKAQVKEKLDVAENRLKNINIVFAIDGTQSMSKYYGSVANSIQKIIEYDERKGDDNNLSFGYIVYRDYEDEDFAYEVFPLTPKGEDVIAGLKSVKTFSNDDDLPEAQYSGLINGIPKVHFGEGESNILVIVGDCGNHQPDNKTRKNELYELFNQYELSLVGFQVIGGLDISYLDFSIDIRDYILHTASNSYSSYEPVLTLPESVENTSSLKFEGISGDLPNDLFMFGRYTYAEVGEMMSLASFEEGVINSIDNYIQHVDEIKARLNLVLNSSAFDPEMIEILIKMGFSDKQIDILKRAGDISTTGYLSKYYYDEDYPWVESVVFLSKNEKDEISKRLNKILEGSYKEGSSKLKEEFRLTLIMTCQKLLGGVSMAEIEKKTLNDVWEIILGVPYERGDKSLGSIKLSEFNEAVPKSDFKELFYHFESKAKLFTSASYTESTFKINGDRFYWIPLSDFP